MLKKNFLKKYTSSNRDKPNVNEADQLNLFNSINKLLKFTGNKEIESNNKLLDIGSGLGSFYNLCKKLGVEAEKTDGSIDNIDFEKDAISFNDDYFDFVIMNSVIEHLINPQNILYEAKRVLKSKGILIIITPNFKYAYKNFYDDPTHVQPYTHISLKTILNICDFKNTKVNPFLVNKPNFYWKIPFKFLFASKIPFKNHTCKSFPIPNFLRGNSTSMISISIK